MTTRTTVEQLYPAENITDFSGVWVVETIDDGSIVIGGIWARTGQRIALFRQDDQMCMFGDPGFAFNSYEQFHFLYDWDDGFLYSKNQGPGVFVQVGFSDQERTQIYFKFSGSAGDDCHGDSGGWGGGGAGNP